MLMNEGVGGPGATVRARTRDLKDKTFGAVSPRLSGCKVPHPPEVDQVPPPVVSEPNKSVLAARAANDGAQLPHLVDHRPSQPTGAPASAAGVLSGTHLEGEDLSEGPSRGVAVQPEFVVQSSL